MNTLEIIQKSEEMQKSTNQRYVIEIRDLAEMVMYLALAVKQLQADVRLLSEREVD